MNGCLFLIGRDQPLFADDLRIWEPHIAQQVHSGSFLVVGGAGSIGQAVVKELFKRHPRRLYVVDISENNMVELVRDLRSSLGYLDGVFRTFILDCGSREFDVFLKQEGSFDYILNLSALKHVRSERDPYTLMRMIEVNILNTNRTVQSAIEQGTHKYFCVSTDKATNPVNMMGASKRIMELHLMRWNQQIPISTARFANVAFSDGSLLHGFSQRVAKRQPLAAPCDVKRYFMTAQESGELCLMSCLLGENRDIFFPKFDPGLNLITFAEVARRYLRNLGYEPYECAAEEEARARVQELTTVGRLPCYFSRSDTTGEKDVEEFTSASDVLDLGRFRTIGIIKNGPFSDGGRLEWFSAEIDRMRTRGTWTKQELVHLFREIVPGFQHVERNKNLDDRM
jgi:FlaA1/EpsC-like NDP-sugar epimerase